MDTDQFVQAHGQRSRNPMKHQDDEGDGLCPRSSSRTFALPYGCSSAALAEQSPSAGPCCHCHPHGRGRHVRSGSSVPCSDLLGCILDLLFTLAVHWHASICFPSPGH